MPLARYVKAPIIARPSSPEPQTSTVKDSWHLSRHIAPALVTLGSLMVTSAVWPIVQYQIFVKPSLQPVKFLSPIPESELVMNRPQNPAFSNPQPQIAGLTANGQETTYIDPRTWFPEADFRPSKPVFSPIDSYTLSIPKVDIEVAKVNIDGEDLSKGLIQYPGTALPGQPGSPVIFGHSILRQFYNPSEKNPNRYMSIFSKIMTLKEGDPVIIDYGDIRYTYEVKDKVEVKPEDVFILEQRYAYQELKLITCVPEGTYLRRGVVIARLIFAGPIPKSTDSDL